MTEEQQGGTTPPAEATAEAPAPEETDATLVVADDPAETVVEAEVAAAEVPSAEVPSAEVPSAEVPSAEVPSAEVPSAEVPSAEAPLAAETAEEAPAGAPAREPLSDAVADAPVEVVSAVVDEAEMAHAPAAEEPPEPARSRGPEPTTMEELLAEQDGDIKSFKHGDVVEGTVVRIDKDEILVDIGAKSEGVVSNRELFGRHGEAQPALAVGDTVLVYVLQPESPEGHVVLSLRRAGLERKWRSMQEQFEAGVIIEAPVIDHNKGGLIVDCGIRGFVPISQIVDFPRRPQNDQPRDAAQEIAEKLQPFVGRKLRLKILEVNRKANRLILSEKVALYEERREKRDELFSSLQVGQKVTGTVRSIAPFGVFIDLGGIDGLVHKSELSWNKVNNPEAGYRVGEEVEAEVIDINHERGRISLSIRRLQPDPWHSTVADFKVGDVIDGSVTKLVNFGAFVRVRDGLEGLIHISELSHQRVAHPGDVVHEGQNLKLKIISLDSERHRLGLSLKQAEEPPARPMPEPGAPPPVQPPQPRPERRPRTGGGERSVGIRPPTRFRNRRVASIPRSRPRSPRCPRAACGRRAGGGRAEASAEAVAEPSRSRAAEPVGGRRRRARAGGRRRRARAGGRVAAEPEPEAVAAEPEPEAVAPSPSRRPSPPSGRAVAGARRRRRARAGGRRRRARAGGRRRGGRRRRPIGRRARAGGRARPSRPTRARAGGRRRRARGRGRSAAGLTAPPGRVTHASNGPPATRRAVRRPGGEPGERSARTRSGWDAGRRGLVHGDRVLA